MPVVELTADTFGTAIEENHVVLVDFWASWCGPCRMFAPIYEAASEGHPGVVFAKVDTDAERDLAAAASITSIPTLMAFKDGQLVFRQAGALPSASLEQLIRAVLGLESSDERDVENAS